MLYSCTHTATVGVKGLNEFCLHVGSIDRSRVADSCLWYYCNTATLWAVEQPVCLCLLCTCRNMYCKIVFISVAHSNSEIERYV